MSFASYKKNKTTDFAKLTKTVQDYADGNKNKFKDERFWTPTIDKAGNGSATIRFLPAPDGEDLPWAKYADHNFDENGNYFVENCPTTIGGKCPVCDDIKPYWKLKDEGDKEAEKLLAARKKKIHYVSNILVIKDKENPENEGKVFLYKYGVKIFDKIGLKLNPKDEDDPKVNIFSFWEGSDFKIEIKKVYGYRNYDDSEFRAPSELFKGDDKKLEEVYNKLYKLAPFTEEDKFKEYSVLEKKYQETLNGPAKNITKKAEDLFNDKPVEKASKPERTKGTKAVNEETPPWEKPKKETKKSSKSKEPETETVSEDTETVDDDLAYYDSLTQD